MSRIKARDTIPERRVNLLLRKLGYRPQRHRRDLPGIPDFVLKRNKVVVFVHGCFWHRHPRCRLAYNPRSNVQFWKRKFEANVRRDQKVRALLRRLGWHTIVVWQCQLDFPTKVYAQLYRGIRKNKLG